MRILAIIFGLIGVLGAGFTGAVRLNKIQEQKPLEEVIRALDPDYENKIRSTYAMLVSTVLGLVGVLFAAQRKGIVAGAIFLIAFIFPLVFIQEKMTAIMPGGLLIAGILSLLIKKPAASPGM